IDHGPVLLFTAKLAAIVWFAVTLVNVYEPTAPTDEPSTVTSATWNPEFGVIVKAWFAPCATTTAPLGAIEPFAPALAVIVNVELPAKLAVIVCFAVTLVNV